MGDLIVLKDRRADRTRARAGASPVFFFNLCCPFSYLAAERIERDLGEAKWVPSAVVDPHTWTCRPTCVPPPSAARPHCGCRSCGRTGSPRAPTAMRAAAHAAEVGADARFVLAASRLAFCGGFDVEDPEIVAEAAAWAGVPLADCLAAAGDPERDEPQLATARGLRAKGIEQLPAIRIGRRWFGGQRRLAEAVAFLRAPALYGRPLAPVG